MMGFLGLRRRGNQISVPRLPLCDNMDDMSLLVKVTRLGLAASITEVWSTDSLEGRSGF